MIEASQLSRITNKSGGLQAHPTALVAAASVAERIAVLDAGRIVEIGDTADVLGAPQHAHAHARALVEARRLSQA